MSPTLTQLVAAASAGLSRNPDVVAAAPGRVNLIGEHIDYCDGFVMPFALDRYIVIAAVRNGSDIANVSSAGLADASIS